MPLHYRWHKKPDAVGVKIDTEADAAYARFNTKPVARTVEFAEVRAPDGHRTQKIQLDLAADGTLVGVEVLAYSRPIREPRCRL